MPLCLCKDSGGLQGIYPLFIPMYEIFSTGSYRTWLVGLGVPLINMDSCLSALSSVVGGRLRRPFLGGTFLRTSASPRGGAIIALPLHGIGLLFVSLLQSLPLISPLLPGIPLTLHTAELLRSCRPVLLTAVILVHEILPSPPYRTAAMPH